MKKIVIGILSTLGVLFIAEKVTKHIVRVNNIERDLNKVKEILLDTANESLAVEDEAEESKEYDSLDEDYWNADNKYDTGKETDDDIYNEVEPYCVYRFPTEAQLEDFIKMYGSVVFAKYTIDDKYYASVENCLENEPLEKYGAQKLQGEELKEFFEDTTVESRFIFFNAASNLEKYVEMAYEHIKPEERVGVAKYKGNYFVSIEHVGEDSKVFLRRMASEYLGELVYDLYEDAKIKEVFNG